MNEQLLKNIWNQLTKDGKTTSSFEEWVVNVSNDPSVQQTIHGYLVEKKLTDSSFNDWADNTGLKKKTTLFLLLKRALWNLLHRKKSVHLDWNLQKSQQQ